ncbi:MAG: DUF5317 domain-containing protein [Zhenhengia sp.]|uniref:DUF5317 domain-containing protein n=1 Tax=Zhenhengia yiwuensis TaxID=2763666 RepID=A0A926ICL2_9FIRM|nr:DUF5317 domain-containing protein [Zhenhengia yiwuensis]MBC8577929.1 DUF5317 domain-containing protein [Zhenhengia yiwuensis]MBP3912468.1 DUF5317 domain-containing protein [Niameybacter sp.]MDU6361228.1 DUF5317 domain-containing protein [Clostridiales bacterium]
MFGISLIVAIILGYLLKGRLSHLINLQIRGIWLILIGFLLERGLNLLLKIGWMELGILTYLLDLLMYILILIFIWRNSRLKPLCAMGIGFVMNAIPIFANGGAMPVSPKAMDYMGISTDASLTGLYSIMREETHFKILSDIIPIFLGKVGFVISIGDIVLCIGMIWLVIKGMRTKQ